MKYTMTFLLWMQLVCLSGCFSPNTEQNLIQVETIKNLGDFPIPNFLGDKTYTVRIVRNPEFINLTTPSDCWDEDSFRIFLIDEAGNNVVDYSFCSSYGDFEIDFVDLTGDKKMEVVFILGEGRGTNCRRENLEIYKVVENSLKQLYSTRYSDYYGLHHRWWYERQYRDTDGNGTTDLELLLDHDPIGVMPLLESPELIPKEKVKVFRFTTNSP